MLQGVIHAHTCTYTHMTYTHSPVGRVTERSVVAISAFAAPVPGVCRSWSSVPAVTEDPKAAWPTEKEEEDDDRTRPWMDGCVHACVHSMCVRARVCVCV